ncbi:MULTISPECIES: hypothetical protein [unclassified Acetobacterium]|uniref:hypothetical protein n=1 Tax=unclassified Acetobacterium TaxID=2638182 RepID=UPI001FA8692A|nr:MULTISPECIES: hypothetical protein [unclassified Acetobacterium]MDZ5726612.1 hypothetical protein [Acetobacterium sp. K1/6]
MRIPKWCKRGSEEDIFGVHELDFPITRPDSEEPDFLSSNILPFVEVKYFKKNDCQPYNPDTDLGIELDDFCISNEDGYLVPLYLIIPTEKKRSGVITLCYQRIVKKISDSIKDEIIHEFTKKTTIEDKNFFIDEIFIEEERNDIKEDYTKFMKELENRSQLWGRYLQDYLDSCIRNMTLNQIIVEESKRARAIDIYMKI